MHMHCVLVRPLVLVGGLLVLASQALADGDLPANRELCQTEARQRIKPRRSGVDLLTISYESRQAYVRQCMARLLGDPISTGSLKGPSKGTALRTVDR